MCTILNKILLLMVHFVLDIIYPNTKIGGKTIFKIISARMKELIKSLPYILPISPIASKKINAT
jgi:hypothetical protein